MADTPYFFTKKLRFVGGVRVEDWKQTLEGADPDVTNEYVPLLVEKKKTDYMPSAGLIYTLRNDMNLRLGFSQTVNRPEFREIAPFLFTDFSAGIDTVGNPDLERALIKSYDLRWEWFMAPEELFAVSLFYKNIEDPIERISYLASSTTIQSTFQNAAEANNYGLELELRKNLGFITPHLSPFSLFANYTYVDSRIKIKPEGYKTQTLTSTDRPLQGQADHVGNLILEYRNSKFDLTARLLYNYVGKMISEVGVGGLPDVYKEPSNWLDFIMIKSFGRWSLKFKAKNLLNEEVLFTQGGRTYIRFKEGVTIGLSLSYGI
jgi:TonB-dependent receptor